MEVFSTVLNYLNSIDPINIANIVSDIVLLIIVLCRKRSKKDVSAFVKSDMQSLIDYHKKTADKLQKLIEDKGSNENENK